MKLRDSLVDAEPTQVNKLILIQVFLLSDYLLVVGHMILPS
jgi:hypothetical protein